MQAHARTAWDKDRERRRWGSSILIEETLQKRWQPWTVVGECRGECSTIPHTFNLDPGMTNHDCHGENTPRATVDVRLSCSQAWEVGSEVNVRAAGGAE